MKQTIIYEREYKQVINKSYRASDYPPSRDLVGLTCEDNEKDNIKDYLNNSSIVIRYKKIEKMYSGAVFEEKKPNEFLLFEKALFHIKLYRKEKQGKDYKKIVEITSMPCLEIPKSLEQKLIKENFKKIK